MGRIMSCIPEQVTRIGCTWASFRIKAWTDELGTHGRNSLEIESCKVLCSTEQKVKGSHQRLLRALVVTGGLCGQAGSGPQIVTYVYALPCYCFRNIYVTDCSLLSNVKENRGKDDGHISVATWCNKFNYLYIRLGMSIGVRVTVKNLLQ